MKPTRPKHYDRPGHRGTYKTAETLRAEQDAREQRRLSAEPDDRADDLIAQWTVEGFIGDKT